MIDYSVGLAYNTAMRKLGEEIKVRRQELKLTAKDLANKIGVDPTYITYIEKHGKIPSPAVMDKIKAALGRGDMYISEILDTIYLKTKYPEVCRIEEAKKIYRMNLYKGWKTSKEDMTTEEKKGILQRTYR